MKEIQLSVNIAEDKPKYTVSACPADICQIAKMEEPDFSIKIKKNGTN